MATPTATKAALVATLAFTLAVAGAYVIAAPNGRGVTALCLAVLGGLFCFRVAGQLFVRAASPRWLPQTEEWNLLPYRLLLPIQLVFIALIAAIVTDFAAGPWLFAEPRAALGTGLIVVSALYAGSMVVRYALRMARRPGERWFGGAIPIIFHIVLAAFLLVWGTFHAAA